MSLGVDLCAGGDRSPRQVQETRCDSDRITSPCDAAVTPPVMTLRGLMRVGEVEGDVAVAWVDEGGVGYAATLVVVVTDDDTPLGDDDAVFLTSVV